MSLTVGVRMHTRISVQGFATTSQRSTMQVFELDELADAVTAVAEVRHRIPLDHLLRETALNILILTRVATNRIEDRDQRDEMDAACDRLTDLLRQAARSLPRTTLRRVRPANR